MTPKIGHLRILGSIVHMKTFGRLGKLDDTSKEIVFVGYTKGTKAYQCFDPTTRKLDLSYDMIFEEWK